MLGTVLIILLILILLGAFTQRGNIGYAPGGVIGLVLVIVIILVLLGHL